MMINRIHTMICLLFFLINGFHLLAQDTLYKINERLILEFPLFDFPFSSFAAEMAYNKQNGNLSGEVTNPGFKDWIRGFESPSMAQALSITKNLHSTNYYFSNKLWNKWVPPVNRKKYFLNRIAANTTSGIVDYSLAYYLMAFGPVWLHEEFHRTGLTLQGISSFDDTYYRFGGTGLPGGSVSIVRDEDLIRFKQEAPQEMVRTFAAGIEGHYAFVRSLQKDNFFKDTDHPNIAMNILITQQAVSYVRQFRHPNYDASIDTMNFYGDQLDERDFVGWDLTAWVYDMFRPDEPYTARGIHPYGNGIDRAVKRNKLTREEDDYLVKMSNLQFLNFLSPSMLGIHQIRINDRTGFNFALRHVLTSFGYDLSADIFLRNRDRQWLIGLHTYHNLQNTSPGLELERQDVQIPMGNRFMELDARIMAWLQPEESSFYADSNKAGGLVGINLALPLGQYFQIQMDLEGKTRGWVMANPFLDKNLSLRMGLRWVITNEL